MKILVTGGAGFIGSAFVRWTFQNRPDAEVCVVDALTYAGNLENLSEVAELPGFQFEHKDIRDADGMHDVFRCYQPEVVVHFAAESHVDRSIIDPASAVGTNLLGTAVLLEVSQRYTPRLFLYISSDEVYGSIEPPAVANEDSPLRASSPYSASKAGSDLLVLSYFKTFSLPVVVTRCSNNYGPFQFPEKLIPLMISRALEEKALPVYGDGLNERDWLYVDDHCRAIDAVIEKGRVGEIYNISGNCVIPNLEVVRKILQICGKPESLVTHVPDRPGHDRRYALTSAKITAQTGWQPEVEFETGLQLTIEWYRQNSEWVSHVLSGEYKQFYERNYVLRANR